MLSMKKVINKILHTILVGEIKMYSGATIPTGWLVCDGSEVSIFDYPALYAAIGTTYGTASDTDHFLLPDLRGRVPLGAGEGTASGHTAHALGDEGGNEDAIVPYHRHSVSAVSGAITGGAHSHTNKAAAVYQSGTSRNGPYGGSGSSGAGTGLINENTSHTHNLPAHNTNYEGTDGNTTGANMPPYLGINFIIYTGVA